MNAVIKNISADLRYFIQQAVCSAPQISVRSDVSDRIELRAFFLPLIRRQSGRIIVLQIPCQQLTFQLIELNCKFSDLSDRKYHSSQSENRTVIVFVVRAGNIRTDMSKLVKINGVMQAEARLIG